ncbi:MAG: DUF748 domain-containing protein [Chitinophagales bacterium]|nr:DUF748 domain-containing protein [Chitinophagales bacterium]
MKFRERLRRMPRWALYTVLGVVVLIIAIRIALPFVVLKYVNKTLAGLDGYTGHVEDVDMNLYRGAYLIEGINLHQVDSNGVRTPFVDIGQIDISIHWKALLQGSIVGEIIVVNPVVKFAAATDTSEAVTGEGVDWRQPVKDLVPLKINRFEIQNGSVHYLDRGSSPKVDVYANRLYVVATNLTNSLDVSESLVATIDAKAMVMNQAPFSLRCKLDPYDSKGTFNVDLTLQDLQIVKLNDFMKAYIKADAEKGTFSLYAEMQAKQGAFEGYAKPLIKDIKLLSIPNDKDEGFFSMLWQGIAGLFVKAVENLPNDQVATKIPFYGRLDDPKVKVWPTIGALLKNAFIQALRPHLDNEIGSNSLAEKPIEGVNVKNPEEKSKRETRQEKRKKN